MDRTGIKFEDVTVNTTDGPQFIPAPSLIRIWQGQESFGIGDGVISGRDKRREFVFRVVLVAIIELYGGGGGGLG